MELFKKKEINTKRLFELDLAKAICILGMVFVHCFEEFTLTENALNGNAYYLFYVVLDALFGAGTFMICMGVGMAFTKKNTADDFIKRGIKIFIISYILNILRFVLPTCLGYLYGEDVTNLVIGSLLYTDIMQFAGLALLLYGLLKKLNIDDLTLIIIALIMSIIGSFIRFIDYGPYWLNEIIGLILPTKDEGFYEYFAPFALFNWFIIVVFGIMLGKFIKQCKNLDKYYMISTIVSGIIITTYMIIAIPNRLGMMSGNIIDYFQMTTYESIFLMCGAVFVFGIYHYISKLFSTKTINFITRLSSNINQTYCIHWILIGWLCTLLYEQPLSTLGVFVIGTIIYVLSTYLGELIKRKQEKKAKEYATRTQN